MRLINVLTKGLEEFEEDDVPPYAILSHTWVKGQEVNLQEWQNQPQNHEHVQHKTGFNKIHGACQKTRERGLLYLWLDTNCIDRTNLAELSEAINSMFAWYKNSVVCFAYLEDVSSVDFQDTDWMVRLEESRWFSRGWTLQEMIAPDHVIFYSQEWNLIGQIGFSPPERPWWHDEVMEMEKMESAGFVDHISRITGIAPKYLAPGTALASASIAQKMSWVSRRQTTRIEDRSYCMLGLLGINMPLLYGERNKAFIRLQEELIRVSTDRSVFCWTWLDSVPHNWTSILAPSPDCFVSSAAYIASTDPSLTPEERSYHITNVGLSITLPSIEAWSYVLVAFQSRDFAGRMGFVPISKGNEAPREDLYWRLGPSLNFLREPIHLRNEEGLRYQKFWLGTGQSAFSEPVHRHIVFDHTTERFTHGLLLTFNSKDALFGKDGGTFRPLRSSFSYPPKMFDHDTGIFKLGVLQLDGRDSRTLAGLLFFAKESRRMERQIIGVLFFVVYAGHDGEATWACEVIPREKWPKETSEQRDFLQSKEESVRGAFPRTYRRHYHPDEEIGIVLGNKLDFVPGVTLLQAHIMAKPEEDTVRKMFRHVLV